MSLESPKVSVCIASYNYGRFIGQAIQSVLNQTIDDFELVILDNLSTDNSEAVITSFSDRRIRFYRDTRRRGMYEAWNKLISLTRGEYIVTVAADDMCLPPMLEREKQVLESNPRVGLVYAAVNYISAEGELLNIHAPEKSDYVRSGEEEFKRLIFSNYIIQPGVMIRKRCHEEIGGYDPALPAWADWDMYARIALHYDIAYLATPLACFRKHSSSVTDRALKTNLGGMEAYRAVKTIFSNIPEGKNHLRSLESEAIRTMAKRQVLASFDSLTTGDAGLARRNIALGVAIDPSMLRSISTYFLFFLSLFGGRVGKLVGRMSPPLRKAYWRKGIVARLIDRL